MDAQVVKELRDKTNAGMMDCKKALVEANGDVTKAIEILRKKGISTAAKKSSRETKEGLVESFISADGKVGVIIDLSCETDFVAKNSAFGDLIKKIGQEFLQASPAMVKEDKIVDEKFQTKINDLLTAAIAKIGENICLKHFYKLAISNSFVSSYVHMGGKVGAIVAFEGDPKGKEDVLKDVCMQVVAARADYIIRPEVPTELLEKEKEILKAQIKGKPDNIVEKIVSGRLEKFYEEKCLLDQIFIKDSSKKIKDLLGGLIVKKFVRFNVGE